MRGGEGAEGVVGVEAKLASWKHRAHSETAKVVSTRLGGGDLYV